MSTLVIRHFGGVRIGGVLGAVELPSDFPRPLFAYLSLNPRRVFCRTFLTEVLWPDLPLSRGKRALSTALWRLRKCKVLEGSIHQPSRDRLVFAPVQPVWVDTLAFQHMVARARRDRAQAPRLLARALSLYKGAAFSDLSDDWALIERARFENTYCDALAEAAESALEAQEFRRAERLATRLTALEPFREDIREIQIRAAMMRGNVAQAERYYRDFSEILKQDLDEAPRSSFADMAKNARASRTRAAVAGPPSFHSTDKSGFNRSIHSVRRSLQQFDCELEALAKNMDMAATS